MSERVTDGIPIEFISFIKTNVHNKKNNGGDVIYIVLSGSDLYGFPSEDSDFDYRGAYVVQGNHLLGLHTPVDTIKFTTVDDKKLLVEIELFELKKELGLALTMNCNVIEHLLGAKPLYNTSVGLELREIIQDCLSKKGLYNSYRGLGLYNYKKFILSGKKNTVKKYLYVYRGLLAGIYALETEGLIQPNIEKLAEYFNFEEVKTLMEMKREGVENMEMSIADLKLQKTVEDRLPELFIRMDESYKQCKMQDTPTHDQQEEADKWLRRTRRSLLLSNNTLT